MNDEQLLTYDDVMLDWAVSELCSPTWAETWAGPACDQLRAKIQGGGIGALSVHEQSWLIGAISHVRNAITLAYGPHRSWRFRRATVPRQELSHFSIIHTFRYPSFSLGDFASKIKDSPSSPEELEMRGRIWSMLGQGSTGKKALGKPIAVTREGSKPPILTEGYKRSMALLWSGGASIEIFLCDPR